MSDNELTEDYIVKTDVDVVEYVDKYIKNIKQYYIKISIILIFVIGLIAITYRHILFYLFFLLIIFCVFVFIIDYIRIREYKDKALLKSYDLVVGKVVNHEEYKSKNGYSFYIELYIYQKDTIMNVLEDSVRLQVTYKEYDDYDIGKEIVLIKWKDGVGISRKGYDIYELKNVAERRWL